MKTLIILCACLFTITSASHASVGGAVVTGPSGVVTSHGAIGPNGLPNGVGVVRAAIAPTVAVAPAIHGTGLGLGLGTGLGLGAGLGLAGGHGAILTAPIATTVISRPAAIVTTGVGIGGLGLGAGLGGFGLGAGHGINAVGGSGIITNGGGTIGLSGHGVAVRGPPTAPAVIAGPSGKIAADGLWGPTDRWATGGHGVHGW